MASAQEFLVGKSIKYLWFVVWFPKDVQYVYVCIAALTSKYYLHKSKSSPLIHFWDVRHIPIVVLNFFSALLKTPWFLSKTQLSQHISFFNFWNMYQISTLVFRGNQNNLKVSQHGRLISIFMTNLQLWRGIHFRDAI